MVEILSSIVLQFLPPSERDEGWLRRDGKGLTRATSHDLYPSGKWFICEQGAKLSWKCVKKQNPPPATLPLHSASQLPLGRAGQGPFTANHPCRKKKQYFTPTTWTRSIHYINIIIVGQTSRANKSERGSRISSFSPQFWILKTIFIPRRDLEGNN